MSCQPLDDRKVKTNFWLTPWVAVGSGSGTTDTLDAAPVTQKLHVLDAGPLSDPLFPTTYQ